MCVPGTLTSIFILYALLCYFCVQALAVDTMRALLNSESKPVDPVSIETITNLDTPNVDGLDQAILNDH